MAKKNDLKNSMSAGLTGGLDSLIQSTAGQKEAQKPKKAKTVHCNVVMDETYHKNLKIIEIRKGDYHLFSLPYLILQENLSH